MEEARSVTPNGDDEAVEKRETKRRKLSVELTPNSPQQAMDTDQKEEKPKTRKVKKQVRKGELPIVSATQSLDPATKNILIEKEASMVAEDKLVAETEEKKNELETYIYDLRNKLDDQYADLASEEEKEKIREKLSATEVCFEQSLFIHPLLPP